jgi:hypothetical protein
VLTCRPGCPRGLGGPSPDGPSAAELSTAAPGSPMAPAGAAAVMPYMAIEDRGWCCAVTGYPWAAAAAAAMFPLAAAAARFAGLRGGLFRVMPPNSSAMA